MKISYGTERLIFFILGFGVFVHVFGCLLVIMSDLEAEFAATTWNDKCFVGESDYKDFEIYICSVYFVLTTTATVGYGDLAPGTSYERLFCMFLMFIGVVTFTFLAG